MTIEATLERIAAALEGINDKLGTETPAAPVQPQAATPVPAGVPTAPAATPVATPPAPAQPVAEPPAAPPIETSSAPVVSTPEELNAMLVNEFNRLKDAGHPDARSAVFGIMNNAPFSAVSVNDLAVDQYGPLVAAVKALTV